jgi:hypothetical protein
MMIMILMTMMMKEEEEEGTRMAVPSVLHFLGADCT